MRHDYYAFRRAELEGSLNDLEQAAQDLKMAKRKSNKNARFEAEEKMKQAAQKALKIEPHLAYLWFKAHNRELCSSIFDAWQESLTACAILPTFRFTPKPSDITNLPPLSFVLCLPFRLKKPYHSKDDCYFHLLDNPLRKDKVFQLPMVASTGWKGALRAAMVQELVAWWHGVDENGRDAEGFARHRFQLARLFGDEKGEEPDSSRGLARYLDEIGGDDAAEKFRQMVRNNFSSEADDPMPHFQGSLYFFPTFFCEVGLEVINPHNRRTGVGSRGPILMECVPPGSKGEFTLLYVPFSPTKQSEEERRRQVAEDLKAVAQGIRSMLTVYGFGAKTSSGFGTVEERLDKKGVLTIHTYPSSDAKTEREFEDLYGLCNEAKDMADELNRGGAL